ncbi:ribosomal protein S10 domain-containing protein [Mycena pura]|uniref:Ribosomal protein S10 domain-containing protein n=1 Tax=Mycena pura TaxID=153505 RepID=A0AAD6Y919_9AGAR|nr:ribosomal protein S10 domain-containing protein [Mycena pura]
MCAANWTHFSTLHCLFQSQLHSGGDRDQQKFILSLINKFSGLDFDFSDSEPPHASVLTPPKYDMSVIVASTSTELFGTQERTTLQTLPNGFDTRKLPLPGPLPDEFTEIEYAATVVHGRSIHRPFIHPRTHGLPAAQIQFRSHDILTMHLFVHFATHAATALGIPCSRMYSLPTQRSLWTVLRGPFAHKKAQENFERKVHRRGLKAYDADPAVVDLWFKYLRRHAMGGVGMRCVKWERMPIGVGRKTNINVVDTLNRNRQLATTRSKIKGLGDKIVQREMGFVEATTDPDNIKTVEN